MTSIDAKNGSPMARKLAARRLVYEDDAAPDSAGVMPTVLAPKYANGLTTNYAVLATNYGT